MVYRLSEQDRLRAAAREHFAATGGWIGKPEPAEMDHFVLLRGKVCKIEPQHITIQIWIEGEFRRLRIARRDVAFNEGERANGPWRVPAPRLPAVPSPPIAPG